MKITIDTTLLTLGDLEDLEAGKISAIVALLVKFSDQTRDAVRAIPVGRLEEIGELLKAAIEEQQGVAVPFQTSGG